MYINIHIYICIHIYIYIYLYTYIFTYVHIDMYIYIYIYIYMYVFLYICNWAGSLITKGYSGMCDQTCVGTTEQKSGKKKHHSVRWLGPELVGEPNSDETNRCNGEGEPNFHSIEPIKKHTPGMERCEHIFQIHNIYLLNNWPM